ncbi:hypothetical protein [Hymenobacter cellulosivorans]|uniref:DUF2264 domain-containing protein n=1 Tax=Hymenobacter cellulosivorans TaxID=2932249 RepID=A0ABY4F8X8_9BACT|nr:hypothetical protein [Hymenobacter cellulosivorans]UOQ52965.1 hypothetical protein MUN80_24910 [Hymenobacter cellulosivorans]
MAKCLSGLLLTTLAYLNYQLFYSPRRQPVDEEVVQQLQFLRQELHEKQAGERMQQLYPEGFVYLNSLYALTWIELLPHVAPNSTLGREARTEARWALGEIQSPVAQSIFDEELPLPRGAFYQGWSAYVLGRYLAALPAAERDSADVRHFNQQCALIANALERSSTPYLESYAGAVWPADGVMGVAALAWHDRFQPSSYRPLIQHWLKTVDDHLDKNGLIPHEAKASTGAVLEAARGSSQSQLLNFLCEIDSGYAQPHFRRYRALFLTSRLGLPGLQEAARGMAPVEDIDSGPVIWGVGGAASLVGRRTMQRFGDTTTAVGLRNSIEAFGLPWHGATGKYYLLGQLPIADAFIAWSNSHNPHQPLTGSAFWRASFQLLSLGLLVLLAAPFWFSRASRG